MPFRQVETAGGFDPLIRRFESCKGSLYESTQGVMGYVLYTLTP